MNLYHVTSEDLLRVVETEVWTQAVRCIAMLFVALPQLSSDWREDPQLYQEMFHMNNEEKYEVFRKHPLPFFSLIELRDDPLYLEAQSIRLRLLQQAHDHLCPEWWTYIHNCETSAVFIGLTLLRLLFPLERFYIATNTKHVVVVNQGGADLILSSSNPFRSTREGKYNYTKEITQPFFLDLVEQCVAVEFTLLTCGEKFRLIPDKDVAEWFARTYMAYVDNEKDIRVVEKWHEQLFDAKLTLSPYSRE